MISILSIVFALGAIITVVESVGMDPADLSDMTATRIAMAEFLASIVYGAEEDGDEVHKLHPIDGPKTGEETGALVPNVYPFDVTYKPKDGALQKQLENYSAEILARLEIGFKDNISGFLSFLGFKKSVSNAIIAIPKFKAAGAAEGIPEWDDTNIKTRKPICAVVFRGSARKGELLDDISQEKGWILLGDASNDRKPITTLNKGKATSYANKHYLRVGNALYNRFKGFVVPNDKLTDFPYIKRYGRKPGMATNEKDIDMPLQDILIELMNTGKCSKKEVWVTGHSLGGAFSSYFSMGLKYGMMRPNKANDAKWGSRDILHSMKNSMKDVKYQVMHSLKKLLGGSGTSPKIKTITNGGLPIFARDPKHLAYSCPPQDWGASNYRTIGVTWDDQFYDGLATISNLVFGASQMYYCSEGWSLDINSLGTAEERGGLVESEELVKHGMGFPFDPVKGVRETGSKKVHKLPEVGCEYDDKEGWREWKGSTGTKRSTWLTGILTDPSGHPIHDAVTQAFVWAKKASDELDLKKIPQADPQKWCKLEGRKTRSHWCSAGSSSNSALAHLESSISSPADPVKSSFQDTSAHSAFFFVGAFLAGAFTTAAYFKLDNRKYSWHSDNLLEEEF